MANILYFFMAAIVLTTSIIIIKFSFASEKERTKITLRVMNLVKILLFLSMALLGIIIGFNLKVEKADYISFGIFMVFQVLWFLYLAHSYKNNKKD